MPVRPDIICLQEVDNYEEFWHKSMQKLGYKGRFAKKSLTKQDGVAIFWLENKLTVVTSQEIELDARVEQVESDCSSDLLARCSNRGNVALLMHFCLQESQTPRQRLVLATTHLFWDPRQADVKLLQTRRLLWRLNAFYREQLQQKGQTEGGNAVDWPVVLTGDFNSLPGSEVYRELTSQFASAYAHYAQCIQQDTGHANGEPAFTNVNGSQQDANGITTASFIGTLDYILYKRCIPRALLELPSLEETTKAVALPNAQFPSDHLPLICELDVGVDK